MAARPMLTSIGSWPGVSIEAALDWAFTLDLPALPELPGLGPDEDMVGTLLSDGPLSKSAFLARVDRLRPGAAKVQVIGPVTLTALRQRGDARLSAMDERHLLDRVRVRALQDAETIRALGTTPVVFLDEPLLFLAPAELGLLAPLILELQRSGARVGLHSCGPFSWRPVLELGLDLISFDATQPAWPKPTTNDLRRFRERGGRLLVGAVSLSDSVGAEELRGAHGADVDLSFTCGLARAAPAEVPGLLHRLQSLRAAWSGPERPIAVRPE